MTSATPRPNPWTALLESLHSALIDELVERHPEPKPELGLPVRQNRFTIPSPAVEQLLLIEVGFDTGTAGIALLASQTSFTKTVALSHEQLWEAMLLRAQSEFKRRAISPHFSPSSRFQATDAFPPSTLRCSRVIWIPIRIPAGECFFGVGV